MTVENFLPWGEDPVDQRITVPMLSDSCDRAGLRNQVLSERLAPLSPGIRSSGRARTAIFEPDANEDPAKPYDAAIDFIDGTSPGEFIVVATGDSNASAFWGNFSVPRPWVAVPRALLPMETLGTQTRLWHWVSQPSQEAGDQLIFVVE